MTFLICVFFVALFCIADELNTQKYARQHQPEAEKSIAEFKHHMDIHKALNFNTCIKLNQAAPRQIHLEWDYQESNSSVAKEFKVYRNYQNQLFPQEVTTLPFIKGKITYEYTDTFSASEYPCISYTVTLYSTYDGRSYDSSVRVNVPADIEFPPTVIPVKLKKIELHVESRNNESAKLFWNRQENVSNYKVYRSRSDQTEEDFTPIVVLAGDARRYTDHNVNFEKTYTYFVQAISVQDGNLLDEVISNRQTVTIEKHERREVMEKREVLSQQTVTVEKHEEPQNSPKEKNTALPKRQNLDFDNMDGHEFENFCATLLKQNGFKSVSVTKASGDQGIDILATKDGIKYGIQCKCYSSEVGNKAVQEAFSGKTFYNRHVGVVLTNNYFTSSAKELAEKNGIILWDRKQLLKMIEFSISHQ